MEKIILVFLGALILTGCNDSDRPPHETSGQETQTQESQNSETQSQPAPVDGQTRPGEVPKGKDPINPVEVPKGKDPIKTDPAPKPKPLIEIDAKDAHKISVANVDLMTYPKIHFHKPGDEITIGDLHGNTLKLIYFLIREGVMSLSKSPVEAENKFYSIARKYDELLYDLETFPGLYPDKMHLKDLAQIGNVNRVSEIVDLISNSEIQPNSPRIRLLGDEFADRGKNDYLTLKVIEKLYKSGAQIEILFSNHGMEFIRLHQQYVINGEVTYGPFIGFVQTTSLFSLHQMIHTKKEVLNEFSSFNKNVYSAVLKAISYTVIPNGKGLVFYSHAPVGFLAVEKLARYFSIDCKDFNKNPVQFSLCVDKINAGFRTELAGNTLIPNIDFYNDEDPFMYITWNRSKVERVSHFEDGTPVIFVHGHDRYLDPAHNKIQVNLDNNLGKHLRTMDGATMSKEDKGLYEIYKTVAP